MHCWQCPSAPQWEQVVPAVEVIQLVREFIDKVLGDEARSDGQASA